MSQPISCELFDYIEIACMFSYEVTLTLDNGEQVTGTPVSTRISKDKTEYLIFIPQGSGNKQEIETARLTKMTVLTPGARFSQVNFKD